MTMSRGAGGRLSEVTMSTPNLFCLIVPQRSPWAAHTDREPISANASSIASQKPLRRVFSEQRQRAFLCRVSGGGLLPVRNSEGRRSPSVTSDRVISGCHPQTQAVTRRPGVNNAEEWNQSHAHVNGTVLGRQWALVSKPTVGSSVGSLSSLFSVGMLSLFSGVRYGKIRPGL